VNYLKKFSKDGRAFVGIYPILLNKPTCPTLYQSAEILLPNENPPPPSGCTNPTSKNYDPIAVVDDGSCEPFLECVNPSEGQSWVIREGYDLYDGVIYLSGTVSETGELIGLPDTFAPPPYGYTGYMELVIVCGSDVSWNNRNSYPLLRWTTIDINLPTANFENYRFIRDFNNVDMTVYSPFPGDYNYNPYAILTSVGVSMGYYLQSPNINNIFISNNITNVSDVLYTTDSLNSIWISNDITSTTNVLYLTNYISYIFKSNSITR
jgi:hypothetical protein